MKVYMKPTMESELFTANEYIAACGTNTAYKFVCNAGWTGWTGWHVYGNGPDGEKGTNDDVDFGNYKKCGETHYASTEDDFIRGYMKKNLIGFPVGNSKDVIIWTGEDGNNVHCTFNTEIESWEVVRS